MRSSRGSEPFLHERVWFPRGEHARDPAWTIDYEFDAGRLVRTRYDGPVRGEERYHYDGDRLVAIDEFHALAATVVAKGSRETGGRVDVAEGLLSSYGRVIWRAGAEPYTDMLGRVVGPLADELILMLRAGVDRMRFVDTVWLDTGAFSSIILTPSVGYAGRPDPWDGFEGPPWELRCDDEEDTLLREAALAVGDPVTIVTEAVARELAGRRLRPAIKATPDLVVMVGRYGDDRAAMEASMRRINPPETVERWLGRAL